jgi:uncharacterized cofD-like protein
MSNKPQVVTIGGGTGHSTLLRGLKKYANEVDITAVVASTDSGGSSGILRDEYGILPPGDIRQCLLALSESEPMMRSLFQYRFPNGSLGGHNFGNLFYTALTGITGNEMDAIEEAGKLLKINGRVLPVTFEKTHLHAELENGSVIVGETNIDVPKHDPSLRITKVYVDPPARAYEGTLSALETADFVVVGPGDLYTSILPNFIVDGVSDAIAQSDSGLVYVVNVMTKQGETDGYGATDFLNEFMHYAGDGSVDYVIVNNGEIKPESLERYEKEGQRPVAYNADEIKGLGVELIEADLYHRDTLIRHDPNRLADEVIKLVRG